MSNHSFSLCVKILGYFFFYIIIVNYFHFWYIPWHQILKHTSLKAYAGQIETIKNYVREFTESGPRPFGSQQHHISTKVLYESLELILENVPSESQYDVFLDRLTSDGIYKVPRSNLVLHFSYYSVPNLVLILTPKNQINASYVLLNCHYDSVSNSPGVLDNFLNCVYMIEIAKSLLSSSNARLKKDVGMIFLFNGAEESFLLGAHAYVRNYLHKIHITDVINLEGGGNGAALMTLLRVTKDSKLLANLFFESFVLPFSNVVSDEVFNSGHIPAETDFRVFSNVSGLRVIDLLFIGNGHQYHTKYDSFDSLQDRTIYTSYISLLNMVRLLISPEVRQNGDSHFKDYVYFDFLHLFTVKYRLIIHSFLLFLTASYFLIFLRKDQGLQLLVSCFLGVFKYILMLFLGVIICKLMVTLVCLFNLQLFWYSRLEYAYVFYGLPIFSCFFTFESCCFSVNHPIIQSLSFNFFWFLLCLIGNVYHPRCSYIGFIVLVTKLIKFHFKYIQNKISGLNQCIYFLLNNFAVLYVLHFILFLTRAILPISDRTGCQTNFEFIASIIVLAAVFILYSLMHDEIFSMKTDMLAFMKFWRIIWIIVNSSIFIKLTFYSPYVTSYAPKRALAMSHQFKQYDSSLNLMNQTSGFVIATFDQRCMIDFNKTFTNSLVPFCFVHPFCNFITRASIFGNSGKHCFFFKKHEKTTKEADNIPIIGMTVRRNSTKQSTFHITLNEGRKAMVTILVPVKDLLVSWSFANSIPSESKELMPGFKSYVNIIATSYDHGQVQFSFTITKNQSHQKSILIVSKSTFVSADKLAEFTSKFPEFVDFTEEFNDMNVVHLD